MSLKTTYQCDMSQNGDFCDTLFEGLEQKNVSLSDLAAGTKHNEDSFLH
jgi:hypothetical protein